MYKGNVTSRSQPMTDVHHAPPAGIARRDFMLAGAGAALAAGVAGGGTALAQAGSAPAAAPGPAKSGNILVERRGSVLLIGIERPEAQNRFDAPMLIGLGKAYHRLDHEDELRAAVLYGVGRDFSLGIDREAFAAAQATGQLPPKDPDYINPVGLKPPYRSKPVVIAVHGGTKYLGHELFLASDIRVAANDTVFSQGEVARGIFPGGGATIRFAREAGWSNAMRYMLTGDEWGAAESYRLGLVQEVTAPGKELDCALDLANKIAAAAPMGIKATLASSRQALAVDEATALAALQGEFGRLLQSQDAKEFQRALQEGRTPVYRGR
jgi:enoyl-CoA hydratase/carnithine racemase